MNSSAAASAEGRSARSSLMEKMESFPVAALSSEIAFCAFSSERVAIYTLASFESSTFETHPYVLGNGNESRGYKTLDQIVSKLGCAEPYASVLDTDQVRRNRERKGTQPSLLVESSPKNDMVSNDD